MDKELLLKGGRVLRIPGDLTGELDMLVCDGRIKEIGKGLSAPGAMVLDATDCVVAPGLVDVHAHLREPGLEYKEDIASGSRAAVSGGFTAVFCMPNTEPAIDNSSVAEYVYDRGVDSGLCTVMPHGAITQGRKGEILAPMGEMGSCRARVRGFSDDGDPVVNSEIMRRAMEYSRTMEALIISHSEEKSLTAGGQMNEGYYSTLLGLRGMPVEAEQIGIFRDVCLAARTGARLHLAHVSTAGSVEIVRRAKAAGTRVTCEVTPHHFSLDDSLLTGYDSNLKVNPPIRSRREVDALLEALADGTIDIIATDHAPHAPHEKEAEFDRAEFGVVGLETCLGLVISKLVDAGVLTLQEAVAKMTAAPSSMMEMDRLGYSPMLEEGSPANLVVFNPDLEWTVEPKRFRSRARNTPFGGWKLKGRVIHTVYMGKPVLVEGEIPGEPQRGTERRRRAGLSGERAE